MFVRFRIMLQNKYGLVTVKTLKENWIAEHEFEGSIRKMPSDEDFLHMALADSYRLKKAQLRESASRIKDAASQKLSNIGAFLKKACTGKDEYETVWKSGIVGFTCIFIVNFVVTSVRLWFGIT